MHPEHQAPTDPGGMRQRVKQAHVFTSLLMILFTIQLFTCASTYIWELTFPLQDME